MKIADMHCDSIARAKFELDPVMRDCTNTHINFERLKKYGSLVQCFAVFPSARATYSHVDGATELLYDRYRWIRNGFYREMRANGDIIRQARSVSDILENDKNGIVSAFLTVEDGACVENDLKHLDEFYDDGVRIYGLIWNNENQLAYPQSRDAETMKKPLKPFGIEVVQRLNELNIVVDVSHLNDGGFWDVAKYSKKPFIATHSNARAITGHMRNLTDEQLKTLAEKGGMTGINFSHYFLSDRGDHHTKISDLVRHAKYMVNVAGEDHVGFGSDFDGIDTTILEFDGYAGMPEIIDAFSKEFTSSQIEKICYKNFLRVLSDNGL